MGLANGYGRYIYQSGSYYLGNFVDGKRSGLGKLMYECGTFKEGLWVNDEFVEDPDKEIVY